jgi:hypothetical protein
VITEQRLRKLVVKRLRELGALVTIIESHATAPGVFDLFVAHNGHSIWLELKVGNNGLRPAQLAWGLIAKDRGCVVRVVRVVDDLLFLRSLDDVTLYSSPLGNVQWEKLLQPNTKL